MAASNLLSLSLIPILAFHSMIESVSGQSRNLAITADNFVVNLYVDGQVQVLGDEAYNWEVPVVVPLSPLSRLVAIRAYTLSVNCEGILGSVTDDYHLTNSDWKCSTSSATGWMQLGFDDSSWANAVALDRNSPPFVSCNAWHALTSISENAFWIWAQNPTDTVINCRGYLPLCSTNSPCLNGGICLQNNAEICQCLEGYLGQFCEIDISQSRNLTITADNLFVNLYIDGQVQVLSDEAYNWEVPVVVPLSPLSRLVAVRAASLNANCEGILGSGTDDYHLTNSDWKCSQFLAPGWMQLGFDDSSWANAVSLNRNSPPFEHCSLWHTLTSISENAFWIWTQNPTNNIINCRGYLPLCSTNSPCLNGGTCLQNNVAICQCPAGYLGPFCEISP